MDTWRIQKVNQQKCGYDCHKSEVVWNPWITHISVGICHTSLIWVFPLAKWNGTLGCKLKVCVWGMEGRMMVDSNVDICGNGLFVLDLVISCYIIWLIYSYIEFGTYPDDQWLASAYSVPVQISCSSCCPVRMHLRWLGSYSY
jgi:hypothetical protein